MRYNESQHIIFALLIRHLIILTTDNTPSCQRDEFPCPNGLCISIHNLCDGFQDCADGDDERPENCPRTEPPYQPPPFVSTTISSRMTIRKFTEFFFQYADMSRT